METEQVFGKELYRRVVDSVELSRFMVPSQKGFANAVRQVRAIRFKEGIETPLVLVSTVCPPYSTDEQGRPDYRELEEGISYNIEQHLKMVPPLVQLIEEASIPVIHIFLMADTEVDLHPFLEQKLEISPEEFIRRCQKSVEEIAHRTAMLYGLERYHQFNLPAASRFLDFFGFDKWYDRYNLLKADLLNEVTQCPEGEMATLLKNDFRERRKLIVELLGKVDEKAGMEHIARQKAQYMAFGSLIRERFDKRVFVFNHTTPNFRAMNDRRSRFLGGDQYQPEIVLFELNVSSMPGGSCD